MNNYNYMSIGRKLCKADDQNNTIAGLIGENAHIDHPIALQTDHPKLLFFQRV
jgi:hypothetical protein